jgi:hypothetical protein
VDSRPNIKIVSCTRGIKTDTVLYQSLLHSTYGDCVIWYEHNDKPLTVCYNEVIDSYRKETDQPIIVFVHDDVWLDDINFPEKLKTYSNRYDIMGVAGATKVNMNNEVIAWHLINGDCKYGSVMHRSNGVYFMSDFSAGKKTPKQVLTIDGLFMAMTPSAYNDIKFDYQFMWDFYDLDLCIEAYNHKLNVGVIPIQVTHESCGEGVNSYKYKEAQKLFTHKWST